MRKKESLHFRLKEYERLCERVGQEPKKYENRFGTRTKTLETVNREISDLKFQAKQQAKERERERRAEEAERLSSWLQLEKEERKRKEAIEHPSYVQDGIHLVRLGPDGKPDPAEQRKLEEYRSRRDRRIRNQNDDVFSR